MPTQYFTAPDTWAGGHYELDLLVDSMSDTELAAAWSRLWSHPALDGGYLHRDREPDEQARVPPAEFTRGYGLARLPGGERVACGAAYYPRWRDEYPYLHLYIPLGALESIYPVNGYPIGPDYDPEWKTWIP